MTTHKGVRIRLLLAVLGGILAILLHGCGSSNSAPPGPAGTFFGASQPVGNGIMRTYVTLNNAGKPTSVGVKLTAAALTGLPSTGIPAAFTVFLPPQAAAAGIPVDHIYIIYQPTGHAPPGIWDVPQFDFYFFNVTQAFRQQIQTIGPDNFKKMYTVPSSEESPPTYFLFTNSDAPTIGVHDVWFQAPELVGKGFTYSMDYIYWNGHLVALEPYIATSFMQQQVAQVNNLEAPQKYPQSGYWPTQFVNRYDPVAQEYTIALEGLAFRSN